MADLTGWNDELYATLPGATADLIALQVIKILRDFSRQSGAWIREESTNIVAAQSEYDLSAASGTHAGDAVFVWKVTVDQQRYGLSDVAPASGLSLTGSFAYCTSPGVIELVPTPTANSTNGLVASVAYMPTEDASTIDDVFVSQWYEHILNGVKGRMMGMPGKPFSNAQLAALHMRLYRGGISEARDIARRRFSMAETSWVYPRWA
jgi:hypothetical protein